MGSKPTPPNSLVFVGQNEACNIAKLLRPAKLLRATSAWHEQRLIQIEKNFRHADVLRIPRKRWERFFLRFRRFVFLSFSCSFFYRFRAETSLCPRGTFFYRFRIVFNTFSITCRRSGSRCRKWQRFFIVFVTKHASRRKLKKKRSQRFLGILSACTKVDLKGGVE